MPEKTRLTLLQRFMKALQPVFYNDDVVKRLHTYLTSYNMMVSIDSLVVRPFS